MNYARFAGLWAVVVAVVVASVLVMTSGLQAQMQDGEAVSPTALPPASAATQPATTQPADAAGDAEKARSAYAPDAKAALEDHMQVLEDHVRALRRMIPQEAMNAESLTRVLEMQHAALHAKAMSPRKTDLVEEADREKFNVEYQRQMALLLRNLVDLEMALLNKDTPAAREAFATVLKSRFDGHREYRVDVD